MLTVAAPRPLYLRTATYDVYSGRGWERSEGPTRQVAPGDQLFTGATPERPSEAYEIETITISMEQTLGRNLFTAGSPLAVFAPIVIHESAGLPVLGGIEAANPIGSGEGYQLAVALSTATEAQLAAAGTDYPQTVRDLYFDDSRATDRVRQLAQEVVDAAGAQNPYDQAKALAAYLQRDDSFSYHTQVPKPEPGEDLVDFFLFDPVSDRRGFCQYYASAMVMMARSIGLPARVAVGFAPGERTDTDPDTDTFLVREANAHAWAEIYFPGYGWQIFEATKSISPVSRATGNPSTVTPPRTGVDPLLEFELDPTARRNIRALPSVDLIDGAIDAANPDAPTAQDSARNGNVLLVGGPHPRGGPGRVAADAAAAAPVAAHAGGRSCVAAPDRGCGTGRRRSAAVGDDLRVLRLARGAAALPRRADPNGGRRQGLAVLLGPAHDPCRVLPAGGGVERSCACRSCGWRSAAGCEASGAARPRSERERASLVLVDVRGRRAEEMQRVVPAVEPPPLAARRADAQRGIVDVEAPMRRRAGGQEDARHDAQRPAVADHAEWPPIVVRQLVQQLGDPLRGRLDRLAAGRLANAGVIAPGGIAIGIRDGEVGVRPALPLALADLDQARVRLDRDADRGADRLRRLPRAGQGRAHDADRAMRLVARQARGKELRLETSVRRQRRIHVALEAPLAIPVGDAVPDEEDLAAVRHRTPAVIAS